MLEFTELPENEPLLFDYNFYQSDLGELLIVSWKKNLVSVSFRDSHKKALEEEKKRFPRMKFLDKTTPVQKQALRYIQNPRTFSGRISVAVSGTPFQKLVWQTLLGIPFAHTVTYSQLAKKIRRPSAVRAAASAVSKNPVAILIPCHRVLPSSGGVGKYHWGTKNKINTLAWEGLKK